jgi:hypothetical protein
VGFLLSTILPLLNQVFSLVMRLGTPHSGHTLILGLLVINATSNDGAVLFVS